MKLTKWDHACVVIEKDGRALVIDPGSFTRELPEIDGVAAVVITHEHPDHWTPQHLRRLTGGSPTVRVIGPEGVARAIAESGSDISVEVVSAGDRLDVGGFRLDFFGGAHAVIHPSMPIVDNVGVLVDGGAFYYGGDSYSEPGDARVDVLAAPVGAPWLKISEAMDYVEAVAPRRSFPTHECTLSAAGLSMSNERIASMTEAGGGEHVPLTPGGSLEITSA